MHNTINIGIIYDCKVFFNYSLLQIRFMIANRFIAVIILSYIILYYSKNMNKIGMFGQTNLQVINLAWNID